MRRNTEILVVALGRVLNAAITLGSFAVLTRMLLPQEYALIALLTAFSAFAGLILINPSGQWFQRHQHEWYDKGRLPKRLQDLQWYVLIASVSVGGLAGGWYLQTGKGEYLAGVAVGILVASLIYFLTIAQMFGSTLNALGRRVAGVFWQMAATGLALFFAAAFVVLEATAVFWIAGQATGGMLAFLGARMVLARVLREQSGVRAREQREQTFVRDQSYWVFAVPLTAVTAALWLEGNGYRLVLERSWDPADLGLFLLALSIPAQMTAVLESFVFQFAYPYFFRNLAGVEDAGTMATITSAMNAALLPLYWIWGAFLILLAPQFLFLVAGAVYHDAAQWIIFGCLLEVMRLTGNAWSLTAQAAKNFRPMIVPFAVGAAASLLAALVTVTHGFTPTAFAAGLVLAAVLKTGLIVVQARRIMPVSVPLKRAGSAAMLLALGLLAHGIAAVNHGFWAALAILAVAGALAVSLGYLHMRTSHGFLALLEKRLG